MIKRLTWFLGGAVAGVAGAGVAKRKVKQAATRLTPRNVARGVGNRVRDAVADGRQSMRDREDELRARLDDLPIEPGEVIVLKQQRDRGDDGRRRRGA